MRVGAGADRDATIKLLKNGNKKIQLTRNNAKAKDSDINQERNMTMDAMNNIVKGKRPG